ncbi:MAG: tRNA 2-thiouridine(34) synthase MnmA [Nitrospirae bacterium]|nr:tRNA 2-thiouridine(34) synthase MnmA [Nitrospirota bacterium]
MSGETEGPPARNRTIVVGMSGGVDSCVAALILKEQGYRVLGVTLKVWKEEDHPDRRWQERSCCKVGIARYAAQRLGIEHRVIDVQPEFRRAVIDDFVGGYLVGETPNPCVRCNERIKFGRLFEIARELGADYLATGHYVRLSRSDGSGRHLLKRAADLQKDQSYFLCRLRPEILPHLIFPLGSMRKSEVWRRAASLDLPPDEMRESQEICFVTQQDYRQFLTIQAPQAVRPGRITTTGDEVVGEHAGTAFYTVGQRRGLGVSASERLYVVELRPEENTVVVGPESELFCRDLVAGDLNLFIERPQQPMDLEVKIRHRSASVPARLEPLEEDTVRVLFQTPLRAVTPGQSVVFYRGDELLGGGIIRATSHRAPQAVRDPVEVGTRPLDNTAALC